MAFSIVPKRVFIRVLLESWFHWRLSSIGGTPLINLKSVLKIKDERAFASDSNGLKVIRMKS